MTRLALIGGSEVATSYQSVSSRLPHIVFSAVVEGNPETARRVAESLGAPISAGSFEDLLAVNADAFDAVLMHRPVEPVTSIAEAAAKAGKHMMIASPLAPTAAAASGIVETCRSAGVRLMAGHSLRFMPSQQTVKEALAAGNLGDPGLLRIHRWRPSRNDKTSKHNDGMMEMALDSIDLANWLFAGLPTEVYAWGHSDYVQVHLGFPAGGMALIDCACTLPEGDDYFSLSLIGSTGATYADDHHNRNLLFGGGEPRAINTAQGPFHLIKQLEEFVSAIEEQREPAVTAAEAVAALQVAEAAAESIASKCAMHLTRDKYGPTGGAYEPA